MGGTAGMALGTAPMALGMALIASSGRAGRRRSTPAHLCPTCSTSLVLLRQPPRLLSLCATVPRRLATGHPNAAVRCGVLLPVVLARASGGPTHTGRLVQKPLAAQGEGRQRPPPPTVDLCPGKRAPSSCTNALPESSPCATGLCTRPPASVSLSPRACPSWWLSPARRPRGDHAAWSMPHPRAKPLRKHAFAHGHGERRGASCPRAPCPGGAPVCTPLRQRPAAHGPCLPVVRRAGQHACAGMAAPVWQGPRAPWYALACMARRGAARAARRPLCIGPRRWEAPPGLDACPMQTMEREGDERDAIRTVLH